MFKTRIDLLQDSLSDHEIDALLLTSSYNIAYLTGIHAFSIEEREARILITTKNSYLFTDARYLEMVKPLSFIKIREINSSNPFSKQLSSIFKEEKIKSLGFEEENITYHEISTLEEKIDHIDFIPVTDVVEQIRSIKDNTEVEKIKKACALTDKAFEFIQDHLKPGVTELEIKAKLENFIRLQGENISFESIIAFGKNSAIPHHMSTNESLVHDTCILFDFGAKVDGYCSDISRTLYFGKPKDEFLRVYNSVKETQELAIDFLKSHMSKDFMLNKAQEIANSHLRKNGYADIPHSLGHGVGLQVHESPTLSPYADEKLTPGMIITVEPGIYIPGHHGVRIEDTALVTTDGIEILTKSPKELIILT